MPWKRNESIWDGKSVIIGDRRYFNPTDEILQQAGFKWEEPQVVQPTEEDIIKQYENEVQHYLNTTARTRGYDNTYTCLSYLNSTDAKWNRQAHAFNEWRDRVWQKCHEILNAYQAGQIEQPTIDELKEQLPVINWNDPE